MGRAVSQELTATELGDLLGVTVGQVSNWKAASMPFRMKSGRPVYVVRDCVRWLREEEQRKAREDAGAPDKAVEEARKMRAQADMAEMERDVMAGALVPRDAADKAQLAENIRARAILLASPSVHAQRIADTLDVPVRSVAKAIDGMMREILTRLAEQDDDAMYADMDDAPPH